RGETEPEPDLPPEVEEPEDDTEEPFNDSLEGSPPEQFPEPDDADTRPLDPTVALSDEPDPATLDDRADSATPVGRQELYDGDDTEPL
ncbi:hypothetical protein ACQ1Z3_15110, partial [Enterococcus faecalis]|uniref:hypothetical protein n=1 Tax=Enterococcus faecalis TaxID=1351 RepID=UPI003D6A731B